MEDEVEEWSRVTKTAPLSVDEEIKKKKTKTKNKKTTKIFNA